MKTIRSMGALALCAAASASGQYPIGHAELPDADDLALTGMVVTGGHEGVYENGDRIYRLEIEPVGNPSGGYVAVYRFSSNGYEELIREGGAAPGTSGVFTDFGIGYSPLGNGGLVCVARADDQSDDFGYWVGGPGALEYVIREGDQVPGMPADHTISWIANGLHSGDNGHFVIRTFFDNPDRTDDQILLVKEPGQPVQRVTSEFTFEHSLGLLVRSFNEPPMINDSGTYAVLIFGATGRALIYGNGTSFVPVAGDGLASPMSGFDFFRPWHGGMNNNGLVAFDSGLIDSSQVYAGEGGLFYGTPGALQTIYRYGDPAPGLPGVFMSNLRGEPALNDAGQCVFTVHLTGDDVTEANDRAVFVGTPDGFELVAREGVQYPGAALPVEKLEHAGISASGRVMVTATYRYNRRGYWRTDANGELREVMAAGSMIDIDPDPNVEEMQLVVRMTELYDSAGGDGRRDWIDKDGVAIFTVYTREYDESGDSYTDLPRNIRVFTEPVSVCVSDFDSDGDVDLGDFGVFGAAFGAVAGDATYNADADFDNDGDVDLGDFGVFGSLFGRSDCYDL